MYDDVEINEDFVKKDNFNLCKFCKASNPSRCSAIVSFGKDGKNIVRCSSYEASHEVVFEDT